MTIPRMSDHNRRILIVGNWSSLVLVATVLTLPSCAVPPIERQLVLAGPTSQTTDDTSDDMRYLLYVPNAHDHPTPVEGWPLILFLHGAFESGNDIARVARHGIPARIEAGDDFPFVVASPQSPRFWRKWPTNALAVLLDHVAKHYPIDEDRVYLTGISKGGAATWSTALAYPNRFAAIAPACAFGDPDHIHYIAHVPVWAYHGAKDFLVPPREGERLVNAHRAAGGETRWTLEPGADHGDCGGFYDRDELYTWFLAHLSPPKIRAARRYRFTTPSPILGRSNDVPAIRQPWRVSSGIARGSQRRSRPDCHREIHSAKDGIVDVTALTWNSVRRRAARSVAGDHRHLETRRPLRTWAAARDDGLAQSIARD